MQTPNFTSSCRFSALLITLLGPVVLSSCAASSHQGYDPDLGSSSVETVQQQISASVFTSDNSALPQEAVDFLLSGRFQLSDSLRIVVFKLRNTQEFLRKGYYNRSIAEDFIDLEQEYFATVSDSLLVSGRVRWVKSIPTILSPKSMTLSNLRESAARLQADLLIVYSVQGDIFYDYNLFAKNEVKAYSTVEMIAFDTRTGIVPISEVKTSKVLLRQSEQDMDFSETKKRAQKAAILESLKDVVVKTRSQLK